MDQGARNGKASRSVAPPVSPGDILAGKYRVERVLGAGGMGVVVAATHIDLREQRAIKFMLPDHLRDTEAVERFLREARASSRLKGEHVAKVHDVGRLENGAPYMVMEYLVGGDLRALLKKRGALPPHEAALYVLQACEALAEAHNAGIVHRDMKPENLFLTRRPDGTPSVKVLDFGISKMLGADLNITGTSAILGSPYFMSPEQLRASHDVDTRADIWSLGVILYQLVTNVLPFQGENLTAVITSVIVGQYRPASQVLTTVPPAVDTIIARCLTRYIDARYPTVAELAEALFPIAPPAASECVERIVRLLRPNSASASDRALLRSYDAPDPAEMPSLPGNTTDRSVSGPVITTREAVASLPDAATTGPGGSTLRSSDPSHASGETSGGWGPGVQSVRVVVQPSRTPVLILAGGGALALIIASVALLLGRASARRNDVPVVAASALPQATASPSAAPAATVTPAATSTTPEEPAPTVSPAASVSTPFFPAGSGRRPSGKMPPHPGPSTEPAKPPSPGDPFGEGRQ